MAEADSVHSTPPPGNHPEPPAYTASVNSSDRGRRCCNSDDRRAMTTFLRLLCRALDRHPRQFIL